MGHDHYLKCEGCGSRSEDYGAGGARSDYSRFSSWYGDGLITEALLVQQRVSGEIDAATYQARMKDLAWRGTGDRNRRHGVT